MLHASAHKCRRRPWSCNISLTAPTMLCIFLSTTSFYCWLWDDVNSLRMPSFAHKFLNSFGTYSPPLSILRAFTFLPVSFSINALNYTKLENVSSFFRMKKIQHFHEKPSIKMTKYLCLAMEAIEKVPQTSKWIHSRTSCALLSQSWNLDFVYFPKVHPLHTSCYSSVPLGRLLVICCTIFKAPWCKWTNILCQSWLTLRLCTFSDFVLNVTQSSTSNLYRFTGTPICFTYPLYMCLRNAFPLLKITS